LLRSLLRCLIIFQPSRERPSIYTNVHATLTCLVKKFHVNNSVHQNKVRTLFDHENLPSSTQRISRSVISSEGIPTPPVDSLRALGHDRLYMNMQSKCLPTNSNMEYGVISSDIQLSTSAKILACILSVLCIRRTGRQNANRESGRNHSTTPLTRRNRTQHLRLRTHRMQHLILRMPPDAGPYLPEISEGSPLYQFLTLVTSVTILDFMLSYQKIKFTTILLWF